jgi:5-(carboxyamino)imidazole ribonucleotide synthase
MKELKKINTIGIIGGGQLGMFLCLSAKKYNKKVYVYSDQEECSAKNYCDEFFFGKLEDFDSIEKFTKIVDVVTVETENIPPKTLDIIENYEKLTPSIDAIKISQNRLKEKNFINNLNKIKTTEFITLENFNDLLKAYDLFGKKVIIKSTEFGYDGKNQHKINSENLYTFKDFNFKNFIAEKVVDFVKEISVISCIDRFGNIEIFPPVENVHENNMLRDTRYPAALSEDIKNCAISYAIKIAKELSVIGILATEMFVLEDNSILINEIAPRPHNSGHWTLDCCDINQFDNVILAITNNKIKKPKILSGGLMINVIGEEYKEKNNIEEKYKFYDYFKKSIKPLRKMGHYTILKKLIP